jgi:signal transduction histidine kinase
MSKSTILIADDEEQTRFCISLALQMKGYETITAQNGEDALQAIIRMNHTSTPIDLLIADIEMPRLNGEELISKLNDLKLNIPSIIITGFGEKDLVVRLMRLGCRDFIDKPFTPDDIEKRVELLLAKTSENALEKERKEHFALLGEKTNSFVHDLNNILCGTLGYADVARGIVEENHPAYNKIQKIYASASFAAEICKNLLELKKENHKPLKLKTELRAVVERIAEIIRTIAAETILITVNTPHHPVWLKTDAELIQQALLNLCINGINAMPDGGKLTLTIISDDTSFDTEKKLNPHICIAVADNGCGIAPENIPELFTRNFTTKTNGHGIGLATVKNIIDKHDGWIKVKSTVGKGTEFRIFIPE